MTFAHKPREISSVYRMGQTDDTPDALETWGRIEAMRRRAYQKHGIISLRIEDLPPGALRDQVEAWAEEQYGRRT